MTRQGWLRGNVDQQSGEGSHMAGSTGVGTVAWRGCWAPQNGGLGGDRSSGGDRLVDVRDQRSARNALEQGLRRRERRGAAHRGGCRPRGVGCSHRGDGSCPCGVGGRP